MKMAVSYININKQADKSLAELINLGRRYVATIDALYPKYRADCNRNASLYTAEALDNQRKEAKKEYSIQLLNTFNELWRDVGVEVDLMRETLACWVSEPGDPAFLAQISAYKDFGLTLSKTELEALVEGAAGNYVALRCLERWPISLGSVSIPSVNDFGRDLDQIRGLLEFAVVWPVGDGDVPTFCPMWFHSGMQMGAPLSPRRQWPGRPPATWMRLEEIKGRWANSVQPMVTITEDVYGADQQDTQEEAERLKLKRRRTAPPLKT